MIITAKSWLSGSFLSQRKTASTSSRRSFLRKHNVSNRLLNSPPLTYLSDQNRTAVWISTGSGGRLPILLLTLSRALMSASLLHNVASKKLHIKVKLETTLRVSCLSVFPPSQLALIQLFALKEFILALTSLYHDHFTAAHRSCRSFAPGGLV